MRLTILLTLLGLLLSPSAYAVLSSASATPATATVNITGATPVPVTWRVVRAGAPGSVTVTSSQINFLLNGTVVASTNKALSKTMNAVNNAEFFIFSEVVIVPRNILTQAAQSGQALTIERDFEEVSVVGTQTATVTAALTGGIGGSLAVTQLDLVFDNGSTSCTGQTGEERTAIARIRTSGAGLLRGSWQVREGGALGSYRILRAIQTPVSGTGYTEIRSPRLPTITGTQRLDVRLVIDSPALNFGAPEISCSISGDDTPLQPAQTGNLVKIIAPLGPSILNTDTLVKWEKKSGAKAYRIEILLNDHGKPVASQMAKSEQTTAKLSPLTREKLEHNKHYIVRVLSE